MMVRRRDVENQSAFGSRARRKRSYSAVACRLLVIAHTAQIPPSLCIFFFAGRADQPFFEAAQASMHSLAYLSRQLASSQNQTPRTPPSTPTTEGPHGFLASSSSSSRDGEGTRTELRRIQTWSTRPVVIPSAKQTSSRSRARSRSFSSLASSGDSSQPRRKPSLSVPPSRSSQLAILRGSFVRKLSLFRVFAVFYGWLQALWEFVTRRDLAQIRHSQEIETSGDEKESEDEGKRAVVSVLINPPTPPDSSNGRLYPKPPLISPSSSGSSSTTTLIRPVLSVTPPDAPERELRLSLAQSLLPNPFTSSIFTSSRPRSPHVVGQSVSSPGTPTPKRVLPEQKTLVLDLDETLIHSTTRALYPPTTSWFSFNGFGFGGKGKGAGHIVEVVLGGRRTSYYVYKRPFVDYFLRKVPSARFCVSSVTVMISFC